MAMKNRKIFLPALLSMALVSSLILLASGVGASATVPLLGDHFISSSTADGSRLAFTIALNTPQGQVTPMVAVGAEAENDKWTLSDAALQYQLTIASTEGGSVTTPGEGTFTYYEGTVVNLVADAEEGYHFVNWTGDGSAIADVNAASTNITMNSNYSITANFVRQYNLTISSTTGGTVTTPGVGNFTYDAGTVVNLVVTPNTGYRFVNWTGDTGTLSCQCHSTTITMNGDYTITANFERTPPPPINWPLIGGVIAVVVAGLVIFFVRRKRAT
jgi:uncharacterized repeat protein (TIGR02543 family)